jgi:hypothetical protein
VVRKGLVVPSPFPACNPAVAVTIHTAKSHPIGSSIIIAAPAFPFATSAIAVVTVLAALLPFAYLVDSALTHSLPFALRSARMGDGTRRYSKAKQKPMDEDSTNLHISSFSKSIGKMMMKPISLITDCKSF